MPTSETISPPLTLTLFGPMQVLVEGQPLPHLRSRKTLWLLALLTLRHNRPVEREWLAGTLWPDMDQSQAFANLRPILSELRRALGSQGERLQSPTRQTLFLELTGAEVDVLAFDAAIESRDLTRLEEAVAHYRGLLLEGCLEEWVPQEREARAEDCLQALQKLAEAALNAGDHERAVGYYQRGVSLDPWEDAARRGLMQALAKKGDRNAALQVYRDYVEFLKSDPGATPEEQTSDLYARLRAETRRQVGVQSAGMVGDAPSPAVSGYLPHPLTALIGREDERKEVAALLRRSRLVTLTGLGGIGKTRLAIEVAGEVVREYADGVWLVALEALSDGKRVPQHMAGILGLKETPGRSWLQTITEYLRKKRILLVLDNCEHLRAASAEVVEHLLRECSQMRILATSRAALGLLGEAAWSVPALAVPEAEHLPQGQATLLRVAMGYESVQLFVERAQAAQKSFTLTGSNARTVAQTCSHLEGIPLAIELAAARVKAMSVEQIASRLHDHLGLLTVGNRVALPRQQTLRAAIDWSHALLDEEERLLLRRLAVFAGGWSLEAAEGVCAGAEIETWKVAKLLTSLVDKSLVTFGEGAAGGRYRLLEMVRQYAQERLQGSAETDRVETQHRDYFLELAEKAEPQLNEAEQRAWLARLETDHENLRMALAWCGTGTDGAEVGLRLSGALWRFWEIHGHYSEGRAMLAEALGRAGAEVRTPGRAKALNGAGLLASYQGDYEAARTLHEESLEIQQELGNKLGIGWSLNSLGRLASEQGDHAAAWALYGESIGLQRDLGDRRGIAESLEGMAAIRLAQGGASQAARLWGAARVMRESIGAPMPSYAQETYDAQIQQTRAALGEEIFTAAWEEGYALPWERAVVSVLTEAG